MTEIKGKIAAILSDDSVVINRGKIHGVTVGMIFGIKLIIPEIVDPDDEKNVLTGFFYTKGRIKIESVAEKMAFGSIQPKRIIPAFSFPVPVMEDKRELPAIVGARLINDDDWKIKVSDEVYSIPVEATATKK